MIRYKYDTHVHTSEVSFCGKVCAFDIIKLYKQAGYQGIFITDHYDQGFFDSVGDIDWEEKIHMFLKGYEISLNQGRQSGLDVFLGMEIRFCENPNDYLVYGIDKDFLKQNKELYKMGIKDFYSLAKDNGLFVVQAHPFRPNITPASPEYLDGVEVFNGNPRHNSHNDLAHAYAIENKLSMLSGSDFHQNEDLARGGVLVDNKIDSSKDFISIIKDNQKYSLISK